MLGLKSSCGFMDAKKTNKTDLAGGRNVPWSSPGCPAVCPVGAPAVVLGQEEESTVKTPSVWLPQDAWGDQRSGGAVLLTLGSFFFTSCCDGVMKPSGAGLLVFFLSVVIQLLTTK